MPNELKTLSREDLYELVWAEPMTKVAARFGMSDVGLKKICQRHQVPVPGRGNWQKLESGKKVSKVPLPIVADRAETLIQVRERCHLIESKEEGEAVERQKRFEAAEENRILVPETLDRPHRIARETRKALRQARPDKYGALKCEDPNLFYARVGPDSVDRAVRILNALLTAFERRSFGMSPPNDDRGRARVVANGESIGFSIEERVRQQPHRLTDKEKLDQRRYGRFWAPMYDYVPTGELSLKINTGWGSGLRSTWSDQATRKVEDCLNDFMVGLVRVAEWERDARRHREEEALRRRQEEQRRAEIRRRHEEEQEKVRKLEEETDAWMKAERIRAYAAAVEASAVAKKGSIDADSETAKWLKWARDQADRLDPLREGPPSILDIEVRKVAQFSRWSWSEDEDEC